MKNFKSFPHFKNFNNFDEYKNSILNWKKQFFNKELNNFLLNSLSSFYYYPKFHYKSIKTYKIPNKIDQYELLNFFLNPSNKLKKDLFKFIHNLPTWYSWYIDQFPNPENYEKYSDFEEDCLKWLSNVM